MIMSGAQAFSDHFLPKTCLGRRTLRGCTREKRDNIVLIDVDSNDFGDVIILDVPESFHEMFRKKPKYVISIDDDDEDDSNSESRNGACDQNGDVTTSDQGFPTKAAYSSNSANVDRDTASEGKMPVKLSKSKRTYSDKNVSRNRYGLSSEYTFSSDSDCSDCEFMGDSSGSFYEWWEKTCFTQSHDSKCVSPESKSGTSARQPAHDIAGKVTTEDSKPLGQQSNSSNCLFNCDVEDALNDSGLSEGSQFFHQDSDPSEMSGLFKRQRNSSVFYPDPVDNFVSSVPEIPAFQSSKQCAADMSNLFSSRGIFNYEKNRVFNDSAKEVVGEHNCTQQNGDVKEMSETLGGANSASIEDYPHVGGESNCPVSSQGEQDPGKLYTLSEDTVSFSLEVHGNESKSSDDQSCIFTDREKRKETDEYKRAMEEEWASRQKELQRQSEEARRLRSRKKAEKMRIMDNEKRQMQRLKEMRETRQKDEENLNQKDELRAEVKKELRKLETTCGDMSSLLRCLGIHVGGGQYPSPNEIQAAYKRACLKFHPDRFGQCELRQQVEAEEKFKLISAMKDKYLS